MSCLPPTSRASSSTAAVPWTCPRCQSGRKPLYGDIVWVKYSNYRSAAAVVDVTEPANICIRAKSVGFGCGYGFVVRSKLPAIMATVIQFI